MPTTPEEDDALARARSGPAEPAPPEAAGGAFAVIRTVLDAYAFQILVTLHAQEAAAFDLSRRLGIPIVATYRRLRRLEELGVIAPSRMIMSSAGHPIRLFRSHLRSARIEFEEGRLVARIELAPPGSDGEPKTRLEETFDHGPARRKRSRTPRDLGYPGAALELVAHGGERALDSGEAGG